MAFAVGDPVFVQGMPGEVVKVDTTHGQTLYMVLVQQPAVRWLTEQQMPAPPNPAPASSSPGTGSKPA